MSQAAKVRLRPLLRHLHWPSGDEMRVRIGLATGPAVAGVIGQRKIYQRLGDRYRSSDVHVLNLKGKGPTAARFILGKNGSA